jgi:membrane-associated protease RseP (regulator of RpoE activity)
VNTTDLSAFAKAGMRPMQAVLGYELFQNCVVSFDYAAGVIEVWDAEHAPRVTTSATVPMTLAENHPYVDGELALPGRPPIKGRFVIDTGSSMALLVAPEVAARESVTAALPKTMTVMSRGIGGELKNQVGRAASFTLGSLAFSKPTVVIPEPGGRISVPGSIGNIGGQILGRCRVTFDYAHKQVRFEPGKNFDRPFETDMLGATLTRAEGGTAVRWVNPGTPAAEAGLQVGDVVTHVDGEPVESIDPAELRLRMQNEGRRVTLKIRRGAESLEITATLRRLI